MKLLKFSQLFVSSSIFLLSCLLGGIHSKNVAKFPRRSNIQKRLKREYFFYFLFFFLSKVKQKSYSKVMKIETKILIERKSIDTTHSLCT